MSLVQKANNAVFLSLIIGPTTCLICLIAFIGLVKSCISNDIDPIDDSINKSKEIVAHVKVTDKEGNGFRVVYATTDAVTAERLEEISSRKSIINAFTQLKHDASLHWDDLLDTDICDFALFVKKFNIDSSIYIHNIFVYGVAKMNLYVQPNPNLPDCAKWMNYSIEQGNQYLTAEDINYRIPAGEKIYRYWKCSILHQMSDTDERFSHFTEQERLW